MGLVYYQELCRNKSDSGTVLHHKYLQWLLFIASHQHVFPVFTQRLIGVATDRQCTKTSSEDCSTTSNFIKLLSTSSSSILFTTLPVLPLLLSCLFISLLTGFHDYACPPLGHHNAHHILLWQQHAKSWHFGHVCARRIWYLPWGKELCDKHISCSSLFETNLRSSVQDVGNAANNIYPVLLLSTTRLTENHTSHNTSETSVNENVGLSIR